MQKFKYILILLFVFNAPLLSHAATRGNKKEIFKKKSRHHSSKTRSSKFKFSPTQVKQAKQNTKSYKNCRKKSLNLFKNKKISRKDFKQKIKQCKENFPLANSYTTCKKKALKRAKNDKRALKKMTKKCKERLVAQTFNPKSIIPFELKKNKLLVAGVGFNRSLAVKDFNPPGFNCEKLKTDIKNPSSASYNFFGNAPESFSPLKGKMKELSALSTEVTEGEEKYQFVKNLGRIYGGIGNKNAELFFASSSCYYTQKLGAQYTGITIYYLLDTQKQFITPYAAIAFYDKKQVQKGELTQKVVLALGKEYSINSKKDGKVIFSKRKIENFDDENDPKNFCLDDKIHDNILILKESEKNPEEVDYLLFAHIKNMCKFGNKLSRRLKL